MKTKTAIIREDRGRGMAHEAQIAICSHCEGETFCIYSIQGHQHIQCVQCGHSYCDGTCDAITNPFPETAPC